MDVRFINPFIGSVKNVFKTMLATDIIVSKPVIKEHDEANADVSAVIGLSGDASGCVVLSFPTRTAAAAASKFAGAEMDEKNPDFADALGELANMVAGHAKANLEGLNLSISLPSVIIGKEHTVSQSRIAPRLSLPCDSSLGRFAVEVVLVVEKKPAAVSAAPVPAGVGA
ncbi:MAG: chemotaxis protein CheX [Phycisphaerae bacterium]|nr:chemotaxis protein CheX [Phycisphaerae bacterium]